MSVIVSPLPSQAFLTASQTASDIGEELEHLSDITGGSGSPGQDRPTYESSHGLRQNGQQCR